MEKMSRDEASRTLHKLVAFLHSVLPQQPGGEALWSHWDRYATFDTCVMSILDACRRYFRPNLQPVLLTEILRRFSWYHCENGHFRIACLLADYAIHLCNVAFSFGTHIGFSTWFMKDMRSHHFNTKGAIGARLPLPNHGRDMFEMSLRIRQENMRKGNAQDKKWISQQSEI